MNNLRYKKWLRWTVISFTSGSLIGALVPLLTQAAWPQHAVTQVITLMLAH
jgi:hypothetical protein